MKLSSLILFGTIASFGLAKGLQHQTLDDLIFSFRNGSIYSGMDNDFLRYARTGSEEEKTKGSFYSARFYQRQYEITGEPDSATYALVYYGRCLATPHSRNQWESDAHFYRAILFLELGNSKAKDEVSRINPFSDAEIYLDDVVWTSDRRYMIKSSFKSEDLKRELKDAIGGLKNNFSDMQVQQVAACLRKWCRGHISNN